MKITGKRLREAVQVLMWILFFGAGLLFYSVFFSWQKALLCAVIQNVLSLFLFYGNFFFVDFFFEKKHFRVYGMLFLSVSVLAVFLRIYLNNLFFSAPFEESILVFRPEVRLWFFAFFTTVPLLLLSFFFQLLRNRYRTEKQFLSLINRHNEAEIQFLKAQINPHFLFNTLHNIYSLAVTKSDQAPKMILLLSDLLRYVIYETQYGKVALDNEIRHLQKFIDLFQMRNENPVNITFQTQGNTQNLTIEPMIFIPLVENCFKHCDFDTNDKAFVRINLIIDAHKLIFTTLNSKNDTQKQQDKTGGVGLENICKRLELQYENQHQFSIRKEESIFEVNLSLSLNGQKTQELWKK
ncbi:MAG: sensor histidine kinase [Bacteroidia bacterium]|nr:sensor histidine kinase [Bacteroidia bacterium]